MIEIPVVTDPSAGGSSETSLPASGIPLLVISFSIGIFFRRRS
jgi:LPXTG-motif cell wall-anchored protein